MIAKFAKLATGRRNWPILRRSFADRPDSTERTEKDQNAFKLVDEQKFDDFDLTFKKYVHGETGMTHYHLAANDKHNSMGFIFKTIPEDSTGKPRLLEKMILCGSEKYPVRDPFAHMTNRSMNSFSDAWTGQDFTSYMFSSTNEEDFDNLLDVYCESLFRPTLKKTDFMNSVWRPEFESIVNPDTKVVIRGQAVDELRSMSADPYTISLEHMMSQLYKGTPYMNSTGGQLSQISKLTLDELKSYYSKSYDPSNCTIYSYGTLNPEILQSTLLKKLPKIQKSQNPLKIELGKPALDKPVSLKKTMPLTGTGSGLDNSSIVSIGWLCNQIDQDPLDGIGLNILSTLLFELPNSPFYREFLEKGTAQGYAPGYGYEQNLATSYFIAGVKGVNKGAENEAIEKIKDVLKQTAESKFDKHSILSLLSQIETQARLAKLNFGLDFLQSYMGYFNHRSDEAIKATLNMRHSLRSIRSKVESGQPYFERLMQKYLIENNQRVELSLVTDDMYMIDLETTELDVCREISKSLSEEDKKTVAEESLELEEEMRQIQNIDVLPRLRLESFSRRVEPTQYTKETVQRVVTYFMDQPSRGITYLNMKINLAELSPTDLKYLYLASKLFKKIGTFSLKHNQFSALHQLYLSGLDFKIYLEGTSTDEKSIQGYGLITASCLDVNSDKLFDIVSQILTEPDFKDLPHLSSLLKLEAIEAANRLATDPLQYAVKYNEKKALPPRQVFNEVDGVSCLSNSGQIHLLSRS